MKPKRGNFESDSLVENFKRYKIVGLVYFNKELYRAKNMSLF